MVAKFLPYLKAHRWQVTLALTQVFVVAAFELLKPWALQIVLDYVLSDKAPPGRRCHPGTCCRCPPCRRRCSPASGLCWCTLARRSDLWIPTQTIQEVSQTMVNDLRGNLYAHLRRLSLAYHTRQRVGDLMYRVASGISFAVQTMIMNGIFRRITEVKVPVSGLRFMNSSE